jgi:hypothetical protein
MSWRACAWAKDQRLGSPVGKSILLCVSEYADPETAQCFPSQARLAADAEVSDRTVRDWLARLERWGLISRERRTVASGARNSDMIIVHLDVNVTDGADRIEAESAERKSQEADRHGDDDVIEEPELALTENASGRTYRKLRPLTNPVNFGGVLFYGFESVVRLAVRTIWREDCGLGGCTCGLRRVVVSALA